MTQTEAKSLSRLVEIEGETALFSPEYHLCVRLAHNGYRVVAHPTNYDEDLPYVNRLLGGRTPVILSDGLTSEELDTLFDLIDKDLAHAKEWLSRDAAEGHLGNVGELDGWRALTFRDPVDYTLYLNGTGDEARNFTNKQGPDGEAASKYFRYIEQRAAHGVIAKGQPQYANGVASGEAMFAYDAALMIALDRWIAQGNLVAAARAAKPKIETLEEAEAYLAGIETWEDDSGLVAKPGSRHLELHDFKETIDLVGREAEFTGTNADKAYLPDERGYVNEDIIWSLKFADFGSAHLHLYCTDDAEDMGFYAEYWMENEPWWDGDDPYECTVEQISSIVAALPEEHRARFEELASKSEELIAHFRESGILKSEEPKP